MSESYLNQPARNPLVSIIVLNYNGRRFLAKCLGSVLRSEYPNFELLFVDNASQDDSVEFVSTTFGHDPRLRILKNQKNFGFAEGNNIGIRHAKGEYVVLLNNDTEVDPYWLEELVKAMESDPLAGAAQSKIISMKDGQICTGGSIDYLGIDSAPPGSDGGRRSVFYAVGAAMILRRKILNEVGLFDPLYFIYNEESDLCWRIRLRGYRVKFVPKSVVYHFWEGTMGKWNPRSLHLMRRNHIATMLKNYSITNVARYVPLYLSLLLLHSLYLICQGDTASAFAYYTAILWNLKNLKYIYRQRLIVQRLIRRVGDEEIKRYMMKPRIPWRFLKIG